MKSRGPFRIPEDAARPLPGGLVDLSGEAAGLLPREPEPPGAAADRDPPLVEAALGCLASTADAAIGAALRAWVPQGGRVLLFEPTRPDLRRAIAQHGARWIDGGRLRDGRPDPAVAEAALAAGVDLVIAAAGDPLPAVGSAPLLRDARGLSLRADASSPASAGADAWLIAPGDRDGLGPGMGAALVGPRAPALDPPAGLAAMWRRVFGAPTFDERATARMAAAAAGAQRVAAAARDAGGEAVAFDGFSWLGRAGQTGEQLATAIAAGGALVATCDHHPWRHRVRVASVSPEVADCLRDALCTNTPRAP